MIERKDAQIFVTGVSVVGETDLKKDDNNGPAGQDKTDAERGTVSDC